MTALKARLVQAAVVAFILTLGVVLVRIGLKRARTNKFSYVLLIVALFVMCMFTVPFVVQVRTFLFLRGLRPINVRSMSIGDQVLVADQIAAATRAFENAMVYCDARGAGGQKYH